MAFMEIKLYSVTLGLATAVNVLLPERRQARTPLKVLWLLHGFSGDHSVWCRQTGIKRYVSGKDLCVIMPAVDRSFYADMAYGNNYYTYVYKELPQMMLGMLPISFKKEDNYIAGLSMGGYGAFKLALNQPERFAAAASLSGSVDVQALLENDSQLGDNIIRQFDLIFGGQDKFIGSMNDLRYMAQLRKEDTELPRLYM
jgi:S-formylglutathione hydrolase FrmB